MKEVTYEDWQKNPTPRMMWVWDNDEEAKLQRKVIYISELNMTYPIFALTDDKLDTEHFKHCAEIEKPRRMTNKELSHWLREKHTREYKYENDDWIFNSYEYKEGCEEEEVSEKIRIREDDGGWREPLVEIEE